MGGGGTDLSYASCIYKASPTTDWTSSVQSCACCKTSMIVKRRFDRI